jgi:hypothetical protein
MFGEPKDESEECNAHLYIADNYGDNSSTIRCQLAPGHDGPHREEFERQGQPVVITWVVDERRRCDHGCGQWKHAHDDESVKCPKDADDHSFSTCAFCHPGREPHPCEACGALLYTSRHYSCPKAASDTNAFLSAPSGDDEFGEP